MLLPFCNGRLAFSPFALDSTPLNPLFLFSLFCFFAFAMICSVFLSPQGTSSLDSDYKHSRFSTVPLPPPKMYDPFPTLTLPQMAAPYFPGFTVKLLQRVACIPCSNFPLNPHSSIQPTLVLFFYLKSGTALSKAMKGLCNVRFPGLPTLFSAILS